MTTAASAKSRPPTLRGFDAGWIDWGHLDFDAVLRHADRIVSRAPIHVVAHSIGGFVLGLAKSNHLIRRIVTMGAHTPTAATIHHAYACG